MKHPIFLCLILMFLLPVVAQAAVVLGTNSGFVTEAPSVDPEEDSWSADNYANVTHDTSPADATTITEIGWWCDDASEEANFEVALYAADGAVVPGEAGTRLYHDDTNAKGEDAGWKSVAVDWAIDGSTAYWLGVALVDVDGITSIDKSATGATGFDYLFGTETLPNPFGGEAIYDSDGCLAIYAVYTTEEPPEAGQVIIIGDASNFHRPPRTYLEWREQ